MCVQNDMLTIAGEARVQNGTHPSGSRKPSPVRPYGVPDSSRRAAGCADSQNFTCARHVRNSLPYRLTFRFVVILRLHRRAFGTGGRLLRAARFGSPHGGLYACTGAVHRRVEIRSAFEKTPPKPARVARSDLICRPGRALYRAQIGSGPEKTHLGHCVFCRPDVGAGPARAG